MMKVTESVDTIADKTASITIQSARQTRLALEVKLVADTPEELFGALESIVSDLRERLEYWRPGAVGSSTTSIMKDLESGIGGFALTLESRPVWTSAIRQQAE